MNSRIHDLAKTRIRWQLMNGCADDRTERKINAVGWHAQVSFSTSSKSGPPTSGAADARMMKRFAAGRLEVSLSQPPDQLDSPFVPSRHALRLRELRNGKNGSQ
jgi:hypothetical protein